MRKFSFLKRHLISITYLYGFHFSVSDFPNDTMKLMPSYVTQRAVEIKGLGDSPFE